jgi:hypothetical protein
LMLSICCLSVVICLAPCCLCLFKIYHVIDECKRKLSNLPCYLMSICCICHLKEYKKCDCVKCDCGIPDCSDDEVINLC